MTHTADMHILHMLRKPSGCVLSSVLCVVSGAAAVQTGCWIAWRTVSTNSPQLLYWEGQVRRGLGANLPIEAAPSWHQAGHVGVPAYC